MDVAFVDSTWMGIVINFICVQSYWCLNEVARDLEDPFVYDPNDLPLSRYQVLGRLCYMSLYMWLHLLWPCCWCGVQSVIVLSVTDAATLLVVLLH